MNHLTDTYLRAVTVLNMCPLNGSFNHSYTFKLMLYSFFTSININEFLSWYQQKTIDINKLHHKASIYNNEYMKQFKPFTRYQIINLLSFYHPVFRKFRQLEKINKLLCIDNYQNIINYSTDIHDIHFTSQEKNIFFNYGMGTGKTTKTIKYISSLLENNDKLKILFITPNITLSRGLYHRLNVEGLQFEHYLENYRKQKDKMNKSNKLIICINSLHYLQDNISDVIICDAIIH